MRKELFLLGLFLFVAPPLAAQKQFVLVSFNTLHYGYGTTTADKDAAIFSVAKAAQADAIVLQEIMPPATFGDLETLFPPSVVYFQVSQNSFGTGNYRERYLTILGKTKFTLLTSLEFTNLAAPNGAFSRPPMLLGVRPAGSATTYYIGNFHAVWGRNQKQRKAEASAICSALQPKVGSLNIALAGDWNLTAPQVQAAAAQCLATVLPDGLTTLNRQGTTFSSSYDHAVVFSGSKLAITADTVFEPNNTVTWRGSISDHVPVYVTYTYK